LKIIKLGMDTKSVIARFEAERQALAMMDHPNIAKVLDAGATETGRPFFVMELVTGVSITEYCDKNELNMRERLALFIQVCNAVQHAHQKGIIHRDIKPSNVMVTHRDGTPVPKIIDFGIAKAINQRLTEKTLFTRYAHIIGTPAYMSPEQAELSDLDIDTRSDIYSLGVLLYELLTGTPPFSEEELRKAGYIEMQRIIREEEPPKPSTKLSTLGETLTDVAKHRGSTPDLLRKAIRGDLDWIVMRCLEKDRTRRYGTAAELAADIASHLDNRPVEAAAPDFSYRARKFVRRNRALVTGVAAVLAVLIIGIVVSSLFAVGEARARANAERQLRITEAIKNDILSLDLLRLINEDGIQGEHVNLRSLLDTASESLVSKFRDAPLTEALIRYRLGCQYKILGEYKTAQLHLQRALQIHREQLGESHELALANLAELARVRHLQGRCDEAESLYTKVVEMGGHVNGLPWVYATQAQYDKAEHAFIEVIERNRRNLGELHRITITAMIGLGSVYRDRGWHNKAREVLVKAHGLALTSLSDQSRTTLLAEHHLAMLYAKEKSYDEAERLFITALAGRRHVLGEEHPDTLKSMSELARLYRLQTKYDDAEQLFVEALQGMRLKLGEEHPDTLQSWNGLIELYDAWDRPQLAEQWRAKLPKNQEAKE